MKKERLRGGKKTKAALRETIVALWWQTGRHRSKWVAMLGYEVLVMVKAVFLEILRGEDVRE